MMWGMRLGLLSKPPKTRAVLAAWLEQEHTNSPDPSSMGKLGQGTGTTGCGHTPLPNLVKMGLLPADPARRQPWGRLLSTPLDVINPGSKAALANLCPGDIILAINGESTETMTHLEAQNKIKACTDQLLLSVNRTNIHILESKEVAFLMSKPWVQVSAAERLPIGLCLK
ncbi:PDZ and LIM domain protein 4 [Aix galericulata]|nr:PDZ and LIM domain protein 4 [Aix galericulata]